jgi:hypothetical protein
VLVSSNRVASDAIIRLHKRPTPTMGHSGGMCNSAQIALGAKEGDSARRCLSFRPPPLYSANSWRKGYFQTLQTRASKSKIIRKSNAAVFAD